MVLILFLSLSGPSKLLVTNPTLAAIPSSYEDPIPVRTSFQDMPADASQVDVLHTTGVKSVKKASGFWAFGSLNLGGKEDGEVKRKMKWKLVLHGGVRQLGKKGSRFINFLWPYAGFTEIMVLGI